MKTYKYFAWFVLFVLLAACGAVTPVPTATPAPTRTSIPARPTAYYRPTETPVPTETSMPTPMPIPVATALEQFPLDNLRMAYIVNGDLYVQDGDNTPKQLLANSDASHLIFSDDGEKIVFRRKGDNNVIAVSVDGSRQREITTTDWLTALGAGTKAGYLAFVPHSHQILFNTCLCPKNSLSCTLGLFLANTHTGQIKEFMPPIVGKNLLCIGIKPWDGNFSISPDGKFVAVAHTGQIDLLNLAGEVVRPGILKYTPSKPVELYPRVFWLPDSSGLIAALPDESEFGIGWGYFKDPAYMVWRYLLDDDVVTQIPLKQNPSWEHMESNDIMSVSPDRNWAVYFINNYYQLYIGNLIDGSIQIYLPLRYYLPAYWSSDNVHFINGLNPESPMLGSVDALPVVTPGYFLGWIDAKHYIYSASPLLKENVQILVGEVGGETLVTYRSNVFIPAVDFLPFVYHVKDDK